MTVSTLQPEFVDRLPDEPVLGVVYIAIDFQTTMHLCACGCGREVVLPLRPGAWRLSYDGESVSLWPSVGNWNFPCRSHYVVSDGRVDWRSDWSSAQVAAGRRRTLSERGVSESDQRRAERITSPGWLRRLWRKLSGRD